MYLNKYYTNLADPPYDLVFKIKIQCIPLKINCKSLQFALENLAKITLLLLLFLRKCNSSINNCCSTKQILFHADRQIWVKKGSQLHFPRNPPSRPFDFPLSCALQNFSNSWLRTASLNPFTVHALSNAKCFPVQTVPLPWGHAAGEAPFVPPSLIPAAAQAGTLGSPAPLKWSNSFLTVKLLRCRKHLWNKAIILSALA